MAQSTGRTATPPSSGDTLPGAPHAALKRAESLPRVAMTDAHVSTPDSGQASMSILPDDAGTADDWVARNPAMVRLTGRHPYNAEPPAAPLLQAGLITPNPLHFVRNHGPVPKLKWEDHRVTVSGLGVDKDITFSMEDLTSKFRAVEVAVTIACDGNRRKELNTIRRSRGFNWSAAAVGTAVWCGARLCDVLQACGIPALSELEFWDAAQMDAPPAAASGDTPAEGRTPATPAPALTPATAARRHRQQRPLFVCFEGADELYLGRYGTSIPLSTALDPTADVLLAYRMNGETLPPDHGFPLRLVVPGHVGGRMVKWLTRIVVSAQESPNHYHWHDNKVLPAQVSSSQAAAEGYWYNPEFTLYEHNINAAIVSPAHNERITVLTHRMDTSNALRVSGYAYSGGGRRITRVEVSLDEGATWQLCKREYPKSFTPRHGRRFWTWCHWHALVPHVRLLRASSILVRATDASCNTQPNLPAWNVLGMMNNCVYRVMVALQREVCWCGAASDVDSVTGAVGRSGHAAAHEAEHDTPFVLNFTHPVGQGNGNDGWMSRPPVEAVARLPHALRVAGAISFGGPGAQPSHGPADLVYIPPPRGKAYTLDEVAQHTRPGSAWVVIGGHVYDMTSFLRDHPGGAGSILAAAGGDGTEVFASCHGEEVYEWLDAMRIGFVSSMMPGIQAGPMEPQQGTATDTVREEGGGESGRQRTFSAEEIFPPPPPDHSRKGAGPGRLARPPSAGLSAAHTVMPRPQRAALQLHRWVRLQLERKEQMSPDTVRFVFRFGDARCRLGLPVGQHVMIGAYAGASLVVRPYTPVHPVTVDEEDGTIHFVIKIYRAGAHGHGGVMSQHLDSLQVGDASVHMQGPNGHVVYERPGHLRVHGTLHHVRRLSCVAGGTGITPMYQLIHAICHDEHDHTRVALLYANHTPADVLMRSELDALAAEHPDKLQVWYTVSSVSAADSASGDWPFSVGRVDSDMLAERLFGAGADAVGLACGPPGLLENVVLPGLQAMGFDESQLVQF